MTICQCSTPGLCINLSLNQMQGQRLKSRHPQFAVTCGNLWYCIEAVLGLFWNMEPKLKTENWCLAQPKRRSNRTWRKHIETPSILGCALYFWWNLVGDTPYPLVPLFKDPLSPWGDPIGSIHVVPFCPAAVIKAATGFGASQEMVAGAPLGRVAIGANHQRITTVDGTLW